MDLNYVHQKNVNLNWKVSLHKQILKLVAETSEAILGESLYVALNKPYADITVINWSKHISLAVQTYQGEFTVVNFIGARTESTR